MRSTMSSVISSAPLQGAWENVGFFPTPDQLVKDLINALEPSVIELRTRGALRILDACAGDGRLGVALVCRLKELGVSAELTCVEVDSSRIPSEGDLDAGVVWVHENFLGSEFDSLFDVVVSNPPYLVLNRRDAARFGIDWRSAVDAGRNLYTLAVSKALDCCREGGVVGIIAPHGWLKNPSMSGFREKIGALARSVEINAYSSRRLFDKVNQDTSVQIIIRREAGCGGDAGVSIRYGKGGFTSAASSVFNGRKVDARVRVGSFVWNREKKLISESKEEERVPVVYGGNITAWHHLDLRIPRYADRQYLSRSRISDAYISIGPCIVVKRSMRGVPGRWEVDCAYVPAGFEVVAENHVIVIDGPGVANSALAKLMADLKFTLESSRRHQGHPNLSAQIIREIMLNMPSHSGGG